MFPYSLARLLMDRLRLQMADQDNLRTQSPYRSPRSEDEKRKMFGALVTEHHARVRNYIRSLGVVSSAVDDISQEAFVVAYQRFSTYQPGTSFPAWVCTIARNLFLGSSRKATRRKRILNENITDLLVSSDPYQDLANKEQSTWKMSALQSCMDKVPDEHRDLIIQRYGEGVEANELAEAMGVNAVTIRQRLHRLRLALRDCITSLLARGPA